MRYDRVTTTHCAECGLTFRPRGRQRFCSNACRQRAYRRRANPTSATPAERPTLGIVYECSSCGSRLLDQQRCPECNIFCRRLGPGLLCPHCDEPITLSELS